MRLQPVLLALGMLLIMTGVAMIPCALVDFFSDEEAWGVFGLTSFSVICVGGIVSLASTGPQPKTGAREAFMITLLLWLTLPIAGSIPFMALGFDFTDGYFETVSGLTTTGATIMTGLDEEQKGLLLWRAILQWIGGVGVIVTALALLPIMRVGGMQLFKTESSDVSGKFLPSASEIAKQIGLLYIGLTTLCMVCYAIAGMDLFDAVVHAMTTMSAGGYSTSDMSIGKYADTAVIEVSIVFMILAASPFGTMVMMVHGHWLAMWKDPQPRFFLFIILLSTAVLMLYLLFTPNGVFARSEGNLLRNTLFSVVSVMSGTGFGLVDFSQWGSFSHIVFLIIMFIGGCAGSAAGGFKIFRTQIMIRTMHSFVRRMTSPHRVSMVRYNGQTLGEDILHSVMVFIFVYIMVFSVTSVLLSLNGLDTLTAFSSAATALGNVGPGLGPRVGPASTFQDVSDFAKWLLTLNMIFGRLELLTVFVVLTPRFWKW